MPTKRVSLNRRHHRRISAAATEAFKRCLRHQEAAEECEAIDHFDGYEETGRTDYPRRYVRRHLPGCAEHRAAELDLRRALGLPPWAIVPNDVRLDEERPAYMQASDLCAAKTWDEAVELRRQLEAAVAGEG